MDLIYKIFNVNIIGGNKGEGGHLERKEFSNKTTHLLCFITHIGIRQIKRSNAYNKNIIKWQKVLGFC
jgi:hypothetical protein